MLFTCRRGHEFTDDNPTPPKICPTCEESRQRSNKAKWLNKMDRKNRKLEDAGISTDDRGKRCDGCGQLMKGYSYADIDDSTGQRYIVCAHCEHQHEFV